MGTVCFSLFFALVIPICIRTGGRFRVLSLSMGR